MIRVAKILTDSSGGTASATTVTALSDGTTYANDVASLRNNLATLTGRINYLLGVVMALQRRLEGQEP